jgi:hypothetical protein
MVSLATCGAFVTLQRYLAGIGLSGYPQEHPTFHSIASNIAIYARATASFWVGSTRNIVAYRPGTVSLRSCKRILHPLES